jgi:hypothetical protein
LQRALLESNAFIKKDIENTELSENKLIDDLDSAYCHEIDGENSQHKFTCMIEDCNKAFPDQASLRKH